MNVFFSVRTVALMVFVSLLCGARSVAAGDFKARVQLAWGSDGTKPAAKDCQEIDPKVREKLRHLRWKNYWVLKTDSATANSKSGTDVTLDKCKVELKTLPNGNLEVKLYSLKKGEAKLVKTVQHATKALKEGELCVIAGEDKDSWDTAWLVIISAE